METFKLPSCLPNTAGVQVHHPPCVAYPTPTVSLRSWVDPRQHADDRSLDAKSYILNSCHY